MKKLFVFYDHECPFCRRCHDWVVGQRSAVPIEFWPLRAETTREIFPDLPEYAPEEELVIFTDEGEVYRGANAWILILWALPNWRQWSYRLAQPAWRPLVRRFWNWVSFHRFSMLSGRMGKESALREVLTGLSESRCGVREVQGKERNERR